MAPLLGNLVAFVVSLVVGGLSLFVAAHLLNDGRKGKSVEYAVVTAVFGAIVWALLSWVPAVGTILALFGWVVVVSLRYPGGLVRASIMGVVAWIVAVVLLAVLSAVGIDVFGVVGIPFV